MQKYLLAFKINFSKSKGLLAAWNDCNSDFYSGEKTTCWPTDSKIISNLIDFFITKGISKRYIFLENNESLICDHSPVTMTVSESVIEKTNSHQLTNNKTNWELFKQLVEEKIELLVPIKSRNEIEKGADRLLDVIQCSA